MPSLVSTVGGTRFGTPQKLTGTVGRLAGRLARGKGTQTKCVDSVAASFALSTKHRLLAVSSEDTDSRNLQALALTFDSDGERLLLGTAQGAVYRVDLLAFRFHLVAYVQDEITCLTAVPGDPDPHVVVGQKNGHICSINQVTHDRSADRPAHAAPVLGVCAAGTSAGMLCSYSKTEAFVWRGGQLKKLFQLKLNSSAHIVKMVFLSDSTLLGAFGDDSVYVWCLESLRITHEVLQLSRHRAGLADVAAAQDSDVFYAAGKSSQVLEFSLSEDRVTRIFSLPEGSGAVARLTVFPGPFYGQILQVLLESGVTKFIHTETGHVVQSLSHPRIRIVSSAASRSGLFLACLLATGHLCLHHSTGDAFRRIVLPEALYDSRPRVVLVDETAGRGRTPVQAVEGKKTTPKRGRTPLLNTARLGPIVREQGEFPAQYRRLIWRHLLELPGAHALFVTLAERGQHPAWRHAAQRYPVREPAVAKVLCSTLSALAWWCPLFAEVEFLPYFIFPFCSVFAADPLTALETVITIIVNWCQRWFEFFPYPPISVLGVIENMLAHHCPELLRHYMKLGVTAHVYGWPLLETAFSEVFTQSDWLVAWDHVLSSHPSYMLAVVVAYNAVSQPALLRCRTADDISYYFRNQNVVSVRLVMRRAHAIHEGTPDALHARHFMEPFEPIEPDAYPVFNKYPTFIVNHQREERERIGREHRTLLEERGATLQLAREMQEDRSKQQRWADRLHYLKDAEAAHRELLRRSEAKLTSQRRRLAELQRTLRQRGRAERDSQRSRDLLRRATEKEMAIGRLQDEIRKKRQESDTVSRQLRQQGAAGGSDTPAPPSPTPSVGSRSSGLRRTGSLGTDRRLGIPPSPHRPRTASSVSPPRRPLQTARSSSTYGSPSGGSDPRPRPRPRPGAARRSPSDRRGARSHGGGAAARGVGPARRVGRGEQEEKERAAVIQRTRMLPGSMDADIGALERQIDAIAADVASLALTSGGAPDSERGELASAGVQGSDGERFGSALSMTTWNSRSAPDVSSSLAEAPSLLSAHCSAQRVREHLVSKWRQEAPASGARGLPLRQTRSQPEAGGGRPGGRGRQRRGRQTLEPSRRASFRSML